MSNAHRSERKREARESWLRALQRTAEIRRDPVTLPELVSRQVRKFGDAPALIDEGEQLTYSDLGRRVNGYARWALAQGLGPGNVACLLLHNCADYLAIWLGIVRTGASVALVNTSLRGASLAHAVNIVSPHVIVVGAALADNLSSARSDFEESVRIWSHGGDIAQAGRIEHACRDVRALGPESHPLPEPTSRALLLYTSGTTGLPKAANVSHLRLTQWGAWFAGLLDARASDRMYDCLPLYHSVGGIVATGAMLAAGGSTVISRKFSASRFWDDVGRHECTLFAYIGELCRFLLNTPYDPREQRHNIRICCGNGLATQVWRPFQERFRIARIIEFYASTEGSFSLYNCESEPGAIGKIPGFVRHQNEVALVQIDMEAKVPLRGADGFCIRCGPGEAGEAIGRLDGQQPGGQFEGYLDRGATERKILRDAFKKGDAWYRSGDLMRNDRRGFFYFVDRIGDTFRRNGENVSTQEVAAVIAGCPGVREATVFGVSVSDAEGRVGMAAIVPGERFDLGLLHRHVRENLAPFARPEFLRICRALDRTETFKMQKRILEEDGFDPTVTDDPIFVEGETTYVPLAPATCADVARGSDVLIG